MSTSITALWADTAAAALDPLADLLPDSVERLRPDDRHITVAVWGDVDLIAQDARQRLTAAMAALSLTTAPITVTLTGLVQFADTDGDGLGAVVALVDSPAILAFRAAVVAALDGVAGVTLGGFPEYLPHLTLGYSPPGIDLPTINPVVLRLDHLALTFGAARLMWTLCGQRRRRIRGGTDMPPTKPASDAALKAAPHFVKQIEGRTVTGIFSVFGNRDSYDDILYPGAFLKTFQERGTKILHLWQHDCDEPPIARIEALRELRRDQLPEAILTQYPEATGGAEVTRTYLETPRAQEVYVNLTASVPLQMSFMFRPLKWETVEDAEADWGYTRHIREVQLYETSDVNWGANEATLASKRLGLATLTLEALDRFFTDLKAGARHSTRDTELLNSIHAHVVDLGCTTCAGMVGADDDAKAAALVDSLFALTERMPSLTTDPESPLVRLAMRLDRALLIDRSPAESRAAEPVDTGDPALTPADPSAQLAAYRARLRFLELERRRRATTHPS